MGQTCQMLWFPTYQNVTPNVYLSVQSNLSCFLQCTFHSLHIATYTTWCMYNLKRTTTHQHITPLIFLFIPMLLTEGRVRCNEPPGLLQLIQFSRVFSARYHSFCCIHKNGLPLRADNSSQPVIFSDGSDDISDKISGENADSFCLVSSTVLPSMSKCFTANTLVLDKI